MSCFVSHKAVTKRALKLLSL